jgi:hypothetical protein
LRRCGESTVLATIHARDRIENLVGINDAPTARWK